MVLYFFVFQCHSTCHTISMSHNFIAITTTSMFLIPVSIRCSITWLVSFHFLRNCLIICVDNIRHRHLLAVILELEHICCFLAPLVMVYKMIPLLVHTQHFIHIHLFIHLITKHQCHSIIAAAIIPNLVKNRLG